MTNVAKYCSFQYRLLHYAIVTNVNLQQWGLKESNLCYFCGTHPEMIEHLLFRCEKVQAFWQEVFKWLETEYVETNDLSKGEVALLLNQAHSKQQNVVNFIILVAKQYIYSTKCVGGSLSCNSLKFKVNSIKQMEKYIAIKNQNVDKFVKKWGSIPM